jgi:DNA polymerase-3 subunit gamma/tau
VGFNPADVNLAVDIPNGPVASAAEALGDGEAPWEELLKRLPITPITREFAANLQLEQRDGQVWHFVMPKQLGSLHTQRQEQSLAQALSVYFGAPIQLQVNAREGVVDTPAAAAQAKREAAQRAAEEAVEQDPVMQRLQERFDARVIPDSIHPLDA